MGDASFVGSIPQHYDEALGPIIFVDAAADMARRVAELKPRRVLETACGTGIATRALRDALPAQTELVATDLNGPMLDIARTKFDVSEAVHFEAADAMALPFADDSFDALACQFGVMFFPDKDKGYREARRVLVPGGHYIFNVWDGHKHNAFGRIAHDVVGSFFPADPPQFQRLPFSYPFEPIKDSLVEAGFSNITAAVLRFSKTLPDPSLLARGIVFGSPLIDQIRTRGSVAPETIMNALTDAFATEFASGSMVLQALVISARA
jgi:ubiquinone/menaquinone biosynthesis C-methylase UbiE